MTEDNRTEIAGSASSMPFRIEGCLVLPELNRIERDGEVHQIEPRVMQVLICLARRPNQVLSRQTLFDLVWSDSVVCEEALTRTISELRRVFRDDTKVPRVIETIRKGGYRLIAPVTPVTPVTPVLPVTPVAMATPGPAILPSPPPPEGTPQAPGTPQTTGTPPPKGGAAAPPVRGVVRAGIWALAALLLLVLGIRGLSRSGLPGGSAPVLETLRPLTSNPGLELFPALSPNGAMIVFSWEGRDGGKADSLDLYVRRLTDDSPVRLTDLPGSETFPCWSPDGTEIAFSADGSGASELCIVPLLGGEVRRLARLEAEVTGLDWSADGRSLVCSAPDGAHRTPRIRRLELQSGSWSDVTHPVTGSQGDFAPACSPDGRSVAFLRLNDRQESTVCWAPIGGGEARSMKLGGRRATGVDWFSAEELVVSASSRLDYGLWKVACASGRSTAIAVPGGRIQRLSLAVGAPRIAFEKISFTQSIRCVELTSATATAAATAAATRRADPLISSTQRDSDPVCSPDGRLIAFVSDRSGTPEVWIAGADGAQPRRLTDLQGTLLIRPRWSPDGKRIAFTGVAGGRTSIHVVEVESRFTRALESVGATALGVWSRRDGDLYYMVETPSGNEVWRVHADGSRPTRIGDAGFEILDEAADGGGIYCARSADRSIWRIPSEGGAAVPVVPPARCGDWQEVAVAPEGFYFTRRNRTSSALGFYTLATGNVDTLATIEWYAESLALSPDRSRLLYDCLGRIEIDLVSAEIAD